MKKFRHIKKIAAVLLVLGMLLSLCACTQKGGKEADTTTEAPSQTVTEAAKTAETETVTEGDKTIVYPTALKESKEKYPVISWANGTSCPTKMYLALLEELAKGGYIVIADDSMMTADGKTQREAINYILKQNQKADGLFYNRVDTEKIGVCGHSQGGRSCINAAQADSRIRCVVSIAGSSTADEARGLKTPCLFLTGTNDMIVPSEEWCQPSYDAVAGRAAYASLEGGIHTTCISTPKKTATYAIYWFDAYLKNDAEAKAVFKDGGMLSKDGYWLDFQNKN